MDKRICAGIVLYNPDIARLEQSIHRIASQVEMVILVDNASENIGDVEDMFTHDTKTYLVKNNDNLGIASALNQICQYADEHKFHWVLTLDQDTICPVDIIEKLSRYTTIDRVGILCPAVDYEGLNLRGKLGPGELTETYACMTSGALTNLNAWKKANGFRDDYFIDFVDNEFCMKFRLNQFKIIRVNNCIMHHQLGEAKEKSILGIIKRKVCLHKPWRYYYMTRNNLLFIWEYKSHLNIIKEYLKLGSILWNGLIFADDKYGTLYFMSKGVADAFHHKMGKL